VSEVQQFVSHLTEEQIGGQLDIGDVDLSATKVLWSCQAIDFIDHVALDEARSKSIIPVL
jgi:hypothetical protein